MLVVALPHHQACAVVLLPIIQQVDEFSFISYEQGDNTAISYSRVVALLVNMSTMLKLMSTFSRRNRPTDNCFNDDGANQISTYTTRENKLRPIESAGWRSDGVGDRSCYKLIAARRRFRRRRRGYSLIKARQLRACAQPTYDLQRRAPFPVRLSGAATVTRQMRGLLAPMAGARQSGSQARQSPGHRLEQVD